jgi:hypothetical protein
MTVRVSLLHRVLLACVWCQPMLMIDAQGGQRATQGLSWQRRFSTRGGWQPDVVAEAQTYKVAGQHQRRQRQATAGSQCQQLLALGSLLGEAVSARLKCAEIVRTMLRPTPCTRVAGYTWLRHETTCNLTLK